MAIERVKVWIKEKLKFTDLNNEFNNILDNGTDVAFPLTKDVDFDTHGADNVGDLNFTTGKNITLNLGRLLEAKGANMASATTVNLAAATGNYVHITGNVTINGFGTVQAGVKMAVLFEGTPILTHNSSSFILPTGANIQVAAGDAALFVSEGTGNWRCLIYQRKNGQALTATDPTPILTTTGDLLGFDTAQTRIPVGADDKVLTADSTDPLGVSWKSPTATGMVPQLQFQANAVQPITVPVGVFTFFVELFSAGGGGGGSNATTAQDGGPGNYVSWRLSVTPGDTWYIYPGAPGNGGLNATDDGDDGLEAFFGDANTYAGSTNGIHAYGGKGGLHADNGIDPIQKHHQTYSSQYPADIGKGTGTAGVCVEGGGASGGGGAGADSFLSQGGVGGMPLARIWY